MAFPHQEENGLPTELLLIQGKAINLNNHDYSEKIMSSPYYFISKLCQSGNIKDTCLLKYL